MSIALKKDEEILAVIDLSPLASFGYKKYVPIIESRGFKVISTSNGKEYFSKYNLEYKKNNTKIHLGVISFTSNNSENILRSSFSDYDFELTKIDYSPGNDQNKKDNKNPPKKSEIPKQNENKNEYKGPFLFISPKDLDDLTDEIQNGFNPENEGVQSVEDRIIDRCRRIQKGCSLALDLHPYAGEVKGAMELITGKEFVTDEPLTPKEKGRCALGMVSDLIDIGNIGIDGLDLMMDNAIAYRKEMEYDRAKNLERRRRSRSRERETNNSKEGIRTNKRQINNNIQMNNNQIQINNEKQMNNNIQMNNNQMQMNNKQIKITNNKIQMNIQKKTNDNQIQMNNKQIQITNNKIQVNVQRKMNNNQIQKNNKINQKQLNKKNKRQIFLTFTSKIDGNQVFYKVYKSDLLKKVINGLENKYLWIKSIKNKIFRHNGRKLDINKTIEKNGLDDNDIITFEDK